MMAIGYPFSPFLIFPSRISRARKTLENILRAQLMEHFDTQQQVTLFRAKFPFWNLRKTLRQFSKTFRRKSIQKLRKCLQKNCIANFTTHLLSSYRIISVDSLAAGGNHWCRCDRREKLVRKFASIPEWTPANMSGLGRGGVVYRLP